MKRALVIALLFAGCRDAIKLDEIPVAYACSSDGGEAQCSGGWRCGFDGRCFDPKGSLPTNSSCVDDTQCADDSRCGEAVNGRRVCLLLGVGSASQCVSGAGCEGGWRCGADGVCFDDLDIDGGTSRACVEDAQCPSGFQCGQSVDDERKCQSSTEGAASPCIDDDGCVGGWRCNTIESRCVLVTDSVQRAVLGAIDAVQISPVRSSEPTPLRFAMTAESMVGLSAFGFSGGSRPGVSMAKLFDGGVSYILNLSNAQPRGGVPTAIADYWLPWAGDPSSVSEFAVEHGAVFILLNDGGVDVLSPGGSQQRFGLAVSGLTQGAQLYDSAGTDTPANVFRGSPVGPWGASGGVTFGDAGSFSLPDPTPKPWSKLVVMQSVLYDFSRDGVRAYDLPSGTPHRANVSPSRVMQKPRSIHAGRISSMASPTDQTTFLLEFVSADGGVTLSTWTPWAMTGSTDPTEPVSACPWGDAPQEISFVDKGDRGGALVRCKEVDGSRSFNVEVQLRSPSPVYVGSVESQIPYARPTVPGEAATIGRSLAGPQGRAWFVPRRAGIEGETGDMSGRALRPIVLDRLPEAMVTIVDNGRLRTFARNGEWIFNNEPALGLVSSTQQEGLVPLGAIPERINWLLTTTGVTTVPSSGMNSRVIAQLPAGRVFTPPVSSVLVSPYINGELHDVLLVTSGDSLFMADVTEASLTTFAQPAEFSVVLVPSPGIRLRGVTGNASSSGLVGFVSTSTQVWRFSTDDLERWGLASLSLPPTSALPAELWSERSDNKGRVGFSDGTVWSLPVMVALSTPIPSRDGGVGRVNDYARLCGDVFATTSGGVFRLAGEAGLASWERLDAVSQKLDVLEGARLFETEYGLFAASTSGQVLQLSAGDGGCP